MSELISRADALKEIEANIKANEKCAFESEEWVAGQHDAMDIIKRLASATQSNDSNALKALEREKGKWVIHPEVKHMYGGIYIECSECHTKYVVQHIEDEKYCRNCGADMRGETDETDQR